MFTVFVIIKLPTIVHAHGRVPAPSFVTVPMAVLRKILQRYRHKTF